MKRLAQLMESGIVSTDDAALRLRKVTLTLVPLITGPAAFIWGSIYFMLGHPLSGAIPLSYSVISVVNLGYYFMTKRTGYLQYSQLLLMLLLPFLLMWSLGGFAAGSMVMIWAIFAPIAALMFLGKRAAMAWFLAFAALTLISALIDRSVAAMFPPLSSLATEIFYLLNLGGASAGLYLLVSYSLNEKKHAIEGLERAKVEILAAKESLEDRVRERTQELHDSQERLLHSLAEQRLAASVFTHTGEGIMITDASGCIIDVNETFARITGYTRDEAVGQNPRILKSGRHLPEFYAALWQTLANEEHWRGEVWNRRRNGEMFAAMQTISAVRDSDGITQHYVSLFSDITSMKEHAQELERIAHFDALTQLPNRVLLTDRLQQALLQCQRRKNSVAVVFLDLDGFKSVNDAHGHGVGDALLITVSQRIKAVMREGDTLARVGGDEFVALLGDLEEVRDCEVVLARMLQAASDPVTIDNVEVRVSVSMGVTLYPQDGAEADILLRHADQAMYAAKHAGRNRYHLFDVSHDAAIQTHREGLNQIRAALANKEFVLFYQPKVNMKTGAVVGAEALIRWQHPTRGLLAPGLFLHIVEGDRLGVELGLWVTDAALTQMSDWRRNGLAIPVSINISAKELQEPNFIACLSALLASHPDVPPSFLELEVLETSALEDIARVSEVMRASQALGVSFALDDFGTGYSSLTYLRRLPTDVLKIDQSFVRDMINDPDDLAIVRGIIGLASVFHRDVIAEGVETGAHGALLLSLGCEQVQGYGIARPMPAEEFPAWVTSWHLDPVWTA